MRVMLKIMIVVISLLIGYKAGELIIPKKLFAAEQVYIGRKIYYNNRPACVCPKLDEECLCLIQEP